MTARRPTDALLAGTPPAWLRKVEVRLLMGAFARALGVEAPSLRGLAADQALDAYREFTAACLEMAEGDDQLASYVRERLGAAAHDLGHKVRLTLPWADPMALLGYLYRGIGIGLSGELSGELRFCSCAFSRRYTPGCCLLMSAFDEGFMRGVSGRRDARLVFGCRLTQGSDCCLARFGTEVRDG